MLHYSTASPDRSHPPDRLDRVEARRGEASSLGWSRRMDGFPPSRLEAIDWHTAPAPARQRPDAKRAHAWLPDRPRPDPSSSGVPEREMRWGWVTFRAPRKSGRSSLAIVVRLVVVLCLGLGTPKFFRRGFGFGLIPLMRIECEGTRDRAAPPCLGSRVPVIKTIKTLRRTLGTGYNPMGSSDVVPPTQTPSIPVDGFRPFMTLRDTPDCHVAEYPGVACRRSARDTHTRSCEEDGAGWCC